MEVGRGCAICECAEVFGQQVIGEIEIEDWQQTIDAAAYGMARRRCLDVSSRRLCLGWGTTSTTAGPVKQQSLTGLLLVFCTCRAPGSVALYPAVAGVQWQAGVERQKRTSDIVGGRVHGKGSGRKERRG